MSDFREDPDTEMRDEEGRLRDLETEKAALESRPHDGFADATRVVRLESEIEELDKQIQQEKQRAVHGEG